MTRKQKRNIRRKPTPKYIKKALDGDDALLYEMYPALAPKTEMQSMLERVSRLWAESLRKEFEKRSIIYDLYVGKK